MHPIRNWWYGLLKRTAFKGKHKIQDHWEKTIYFVEGQPYVGLPGGVFRITPGVGEGKVKIVHQNLLLLFGGNIQEDSENEGSWQGVDGPPDCILAVSDDGVSEIEIVLADPEPTCEGAAIHVQCEQTMFKPHYWVKNKWGWVKSLYWHHIAILINWSCSKI